MCLYYTKLYKVYMLYHVCSLYTMFYHVFGPYWGILGSLVWVVVVGVKNWYSCRKKASQNVNNFVMDLFREDK